MGNRDTAGQTGGRLRLPGQGGAFQCPGVADATAAGEKVGQSSDHGLLISAGIDVEEHQIGTDDRWICHEDTFGLRVETAVTATSSRLIWPGDGSAVPGSAAAPLP
jgi:hypothetical protein